MHNITALIDIVMRVAADRRLFVRGLGTVDEREGFHTN